MPKPKDDESEQDFIDRCMDDETMKDEYDDNDQRLAVCYSLWEHKEDKSMKTKAPDKDTIQHRAFSVEMRVEDGDTPKISGHAAVFDQLSVSIFGFREKVAPGAFTKSIKKSDIRALWNHNPDYVLGRKKSGTLRLEEDTKGLAIEIDPPDTQWARDLMETISRGDVDQMSFAFLVKKESWQEEEGKESIRTLEEVELFDVSPVTYPAYPQTDVKVRSVFAEAGLDFDRLTEVLGSVKTGMPLSDADRELVRASIGVLDNLLQDNAEELANEGTCDDGYVHWLERNRRYLAMAELT